MNFVSYVSAATITTAEYYIDTDPGEGLGIPVLMPVDGAYDSLLEQMGTNPNNTDSDNDDLPDGWEVANGTNPLVNDANADPDGDGFTNIQEYHAGTNPQDQTSKPSTITLHGSMEYVPVETGCWRFRADDGTTYELVGPPVRDIQQSPNAAASETR